MASDRIGLFNDFRGLLVPDPRLVGQPIDTTQSSLTQAGVFPGDPVPVSQTEMVLDSTGTQTADHKLRLQTIKSGFAGIDKAGFVWRNDITPDPLWRGWDWPTMIADWKRVRPITTFSTLTPMNGIDTITLSDDTIISVYGVAGVAPAPDRIQASVRNASTGAWSTVTIHEPGVTYGTGMGPHPCIIALPSGRLQCYYYLSLDTAWSSAMSLPTGGDGLAQVGMSYSDDNGATWTVGGRNILPTAISRHAAGSGVSGYVEIGRLRAAYLRDEVVLIASLQVADEDVASTAIDVIRQYGSSDLGATFTYVTESDPTATTVPWFLGGSAVVRAVAGGFVMLYASPIYDEVIRVVIGSAFEPFTSAPHQRTGIGQFTHATSSGTADYLADGEVDAAIDDAGRLWMVVRDSSADNEVGITQTDKPTSSDSEFSARTWLSSLSTTAGSITLGLTAQVYPKHLSLTWQRSRLVLVHRHVDGTGLGKFDDSIEVAFLGGPSTVTGRTLTPNKGNHPGQTLLYLPFALATDVGWTGSGAGTVTETEDGLEIDTAAAGQVFYRTFTADVAQGIVAEFDLDVAAGGSSSSKVVFQRIVLGDGATEDYIIEFWWGSTGIRLRDVNGAATITTAMVSATADGVEIRVELVNSTVRWWTRPRGTGSDREWTAQTGSAALTDGGGAASNEIRWGHNAATTATSTMRRIIASAGEYNLDITAAQTNPDDLNPRDFSSYPIHVDDGVRIMATDGPTLVGDQWDVDADYLYAAPRILPWIAESPRDGWRSTSQVQHTIAFTLQPHGEGAGQGFGPVLALCCMGTNWRTGRLQGDTGGGTWTTIGTVFDVAAKMASMAYVRTGNTVYADTGSTDAPYLNLDEAAGWTVNLGSGKYRKVKSNSSGRWGTTGERLTLVLENCDGTEPSSGTMSLWPTDWVWVMRTSGTDYEGYRLLIDAQTTADGDFRIGSMLLGAVQVFGSDPEWGRVLTTEHNVTATDSIDWRRRKRRFGPPRRVVEMTFPFVDESSLADSAPDPDYITSSTSGSQPAVASIGSMLRTIEGIGTLQRGAMIPVVYIARIGKGPPNVEMINRRSLFIYGHASNGSQMDSIIGTPGRNEALSGSLTVTEIP